MHRSPSCFSSLRRLAVLRRGPLAVLVAICAAVSFPVPGLTEDAPLTAEAVGKMSLEELGKISIISLTPESPLTTDVNVSVFLPEQWRRSGTRRTYEVFQYEPGIMNSSTLSGAPSTNIRGYTSNFSGARGIATTLDDVPLNSGRFGTAAYGVPNWGLGTLGRIELMKGPASSLYGGDAMHGAIAMSTFESDQDRLEVSAAGGNRDYENGSFRMSKGLGGDARIIASGELSHQGPENIPYPDGGSGRYSNSYLSQTGVAKLLANPDDRLHLELGGYAAGWKIDDFPGVSSTLSGGTDLFENGADSLDGENSFFMARGLVSYRADELATFEIMPFFWRQYIKANFPTADGNGGFGVNFLGDTTENRFGTRVLVRRPSTGQEQLQWIAGYMVEDLSAGKANSGIQIPHDGELVPIGDSIESPITGQNRTQQAGFFQLRYNPVENLYLRGGGRYDWFSDTDGKFTPRLGASYLLDSESAVKFSYGRAFRPPAFVELRGILPTAGNSNLDSENLQSYEASFQHLSEAVDISLSIYYNELDDGVGFVPVDDIPGATSQYQNFQSARSIGGELKARTVLDHRYIAGLGYGYANSRTLGADSQSFSAYPRHSIFTETGIKIPDLEVEVTLWNRIYADMSDTTFDTASQPHDLRPYWRVDLGISKRLDPHWTVRGVVRNLFDRSLAVPSIWGSPGGVPEEGITGIVSVEFGISPPPSANPSKQEMLSE